MKILVTIIVTILFYTSSLAQKDKPKLARFINENEFLVAYSSGMNIVYNVPDLSVKIKFSPGDIKNNTASVELSPKNDRLVVYDSKIKKRIFWDTATGKKVFTINSSYPSGSYNAPNDFKGENHFVIGSSRKGPGLIYNIYDIQTGELIGDYNNLELPYESIAFSASGALLINYDDNSLNSGGFVIVDLENNNQTIRNRLNSLNRDKIVFHSDKIQITGIRFKANEDSVKIYFTPFATTDTFSHMIPTRVDVDLSNYPQSNYSFPSSYAYKLSSFEFFSFSGRGDIWIPMEKKDFYQIRQTEKWDISPNGKWSVFIGSKGLMLVFDNEDTEPIEKNGRTLRQPREVTRITLED